MSKRTTQFIVLQNVVGEWFWHEKAANGEIVAVAETYASRSNAKRAAQRRCTATPGSTVRVIEPSAKWPPKG